GESFHYDANDNITILIQKFDQFKYARLNYHYDALNNLMSMTCKGSDDLYLCPRDTNFSNSGLIQAPVITRQDYNFTPLNRLSSVREILQDLSTRKTVDKVMNYHYSDRRAPLRLQLTDTTWNHQKAVPHHFYYDLMGNITTDGEGNHLLYNAFNQIVQVTKTDGQRSYYSYDSGGKTVKTVSAEGTRYLFYQGSQLINEKIKSPKQITHLVGYLGAVKTIDGIIKQ
ncbi:MAG: RHS repeat protein, partial [Endozoicomonadaceae bacterium]|nr:RHS repeat protein [Endozoicomonadaceae bacterium]